MSSAQQIVQAIHSAHLAGMWLGHQAQKQHDTQSVQSALKTSVSTKLLAPSSAHAPKVNESMLPLILGGPDAMEGGESQAIDAQKTSLVSVSPSVVLVGVEDEKRLFDAQHWCQSFVNTYAFFEPYKNTGMTSFCTDPVDKNQRKKLDHFALWSPKELVCKACTQIIQVDADTNAGV